MVAHITDKLAKNASIPQKPQVIHYDDEIKGFGLRITRNGVKAFILNYSINGHERRYTIGQYPAWSVASARERAKELKREIDRGIDPQGQKNEDRAATTVKALYEDYKTHHLLSLESSNQKDVQGMWRDYILPKLGNKRLKDLTGRDIDDLHRHISKHAPVRANRVVANLRSALNLGIRWGMLEKNPCQGVKKNTEHPKTTYLTPKQIETVFECLQRMPNKKAANIIRLLVFTGARLGEVLSAEWSHFDLQRGEWTKPPSKTKQKRIHSIPLSVEANQLLVQIRKDAESEAEKGKALLPALLFPSKVGKPIKDIKKPWLWLLKQAKLKDVRIHDLRHTFASLLISGGESLPVIGRLLGHSQHQTTMRYAHLMDDPLRKATGRIGKIVTAKNGQ